MNISRRSFIQSTVAGGAALSVFGFDLAPVQAQAKTLKIAHTTETRSTCPESCQPLPIGLWQWPQLAWR